MSTTMKRNILLVMILPSLLGLPLDRPEEYLVLNEDEAKNDRTEIDNVDEDSSISFSGNPEETLLKVLGEKTNDLHPNIGDLLDKLIESHHSDKTYSITPAQFFSTFVSSLTKESMIILFLAPFFFLFLTSVSAIVAVPALLLGLSFLSDGNSSLEKIAGLGSHDYVAEPLALPSMENIASSEYIGAVGSAPRYWQVSY